jgi:transposase InsO family protein
MTDNGSAYRSRRWRTACGALKLRHLRTDTPRTHGKAERFSQTSLREWADARPHERTAALIPGLDHDNTARPAARHPPAPTGVPRFDRWHRSSVPT